MNKLPCSLNFWVHLANALKKGEKDVLQVEVPIIRIRIFDYIEEKRIGYVITTQTYISNLEMISSDIRKLNIRLFKYPIFMGSDIECTFHDRVSYNQSCQINIWFEHP